MGRPHSMRIACGFAGAKSPHPYSIRIACGFIDMKPLGPYSIRIAFTTPSWAGRETTRALPSSVLMMAPRVRMFLLM